MKRIPLVRSVMRIKQPILSIYQNGFNGGGATVNAEPGITLVFFQRESPDIGAAVSFVKFFFFLFVFKKRRQFLNVVSLIQFIQCRSKAF